MKKQHFQNQISIFDYLNELDAKEEKEAVPTFDKGLKLYEVNRADIYEWNLTGSKWTAGNKDGWIYDLINNESSGHNIFKASNLDVSFFKQKDAAIKKANQYLADNDDYLVISNDTPALEEEWFVHNYNERDIYTGYMVLKGTNEIFFLGGGLYNHCKHYKDAKELEKIKMDYKKKNIFGPNVVLKPTNRPNLNLYVYECKNSDWSYADVRYSGVDGYRIA